MSLSASGGKLAWYENTDGKGTFGASANRHPGGRLENGTRTQATQTEEMATSIWSWLPLGWDGVKWQQSRSPGTRIRTARGRLVRSVSSPRKPIDLDPCTQGTWTAMATSMCSLARKARIRSRGTRTQTVGERLGASTSSPRQQVPNHFLWSQRTWTKMVTLMCSQPGFDGKIAWYENTDGKGKFSGPSEWSPRRNMTSTLRRRGRRRRH